MGSLQRTVPRTEIEMGIFTNPSDVPEPGPPPKKETVRVELSGCGFMCGEVAGSAVLNCPKCNASVWSQVSTSTKTIGWVWFTLCYCCCLGCSLLPFCVNDFRFITFAQCVELY